MNKTDKNLKECFLKVKETLDEYVIVYGNEIYDKHFPRIVNEEK